MAKQGLAFRGHKENIESKNRGNFLEILDLMAETNEDLRIHLKEGPGNSKYISPKIQNQVIKIIRDQIDLKIRKSISSNPYAVIFDETKDRVNIEQLIMALR